MVFSRSNSLFRVLCSVVLFFIYMLSSPIVLAQPESAAKEKSDLQQQADLNSSIISFYQPTYLIPLSYTSSFSDAAESDLPNDQKLNHFETQFQFSVKVPLIKNIFNYKNSLNLAYTQLSFWQVYNESPFFRETNYQPEIFYENIFDTNLGGGWQYHNLNLGFIHDSNGRGNIYERSWNRAYLETGISNPHWLINVRPWYVIPGNSLENNRDIAKFLGYERVVIAYTIYNQVFSLQTYNLEHITSKASFELTWSFPLTKQLSGYVQMFSGYGQSLIDYNHYAKNASIGIALNDWLS